MLKRGHYWALGAVISLLLVLLNLPPTASARLKLAISGAFLPLFGLANTGASFVDDVSLRVLPRGVLIAQLRQLENENAELKLEAQQSNKALEENRRIRAQLGDTPPDAWGWRLARVVGREPTTWWRTVQINYGSRHGAVLNQTVLTPEGIVGRISLVGAHLSHVALVGDVDCQVFAVVGETRDFGVIKGPQSTVEAGVVEWTSLRSSPDVMSGHMLMTSGLGGVFPKGLIIGKVIDTRSVQAGLHTSARIKLAADLSRLEEVWILQAKP